MGFQTDKGHVHLERRVSQKPEELRLGDELRGHEIEDGNPQRTDVLMACPIARHGEDVFFRQFGAGGEIIGDPPGIASPFRKDFLVYLLSSIF